jgi:hypothetical protein
MKMRIALLVLISACSTPSRTAPERVVSPTPPTRAEGAPPSSAPVSSNAGASPVAGPVEPDVGAPVTGGSVLVGEITSPKTFNPGTTVSGLVPDMLSCYRQIRASVPSLHGKVKLRVVVNEVGAAQSVAAEPGGSANDPALVSCLGEAMKGAAFPKPGGTAIVIVPLVFRP